MSLKSSNQCGELAISKGELEASIAKARQRDDWRPQVQQEDAFVAFVEAERSAPRKCYTGTIESLETETVQWGNATQNFEAGSGILRTDDARRIGFVITAVPSTLTIGQTGRLCGSALSIVDSNLVDVSVDTWEPIATS